MLHKKSLIFLLILSVSRIFAQEITIKSQAAVVMDAATGAVLFTKDPDDEIPPASLTKLMTMHLVLNEIKAGRASLDEIIQPRRESLNQPPGSSLLGLKNGQSITLRDLLLGMAVISGNDAAAAAALRFAPSIDDFVAMMNREAASLGLAKTRFIDTSGYWEQNMTTAMEFAQFCRIYLEAHPESIADFHSVREFAYPKAENVAEQLRENPGTLVRRNNNSLLGKVEGVDGLKTGYIPESGYNIALTAERNNTRFIAVILGGPSEWGGDRIRDDDGTRLINWAFENYRTVRPQTPVLEKPRIWKGRENHVGIVPSESLEFTERTNRADPLFMRTEITDPLIAPLPAGTKVGELVYYDYAGELRRVPILTSEETAAGGFFKRLFDSVRLFFRGLKSADKKR